MDRLEVRVSITKLLLALLIILVPLSVLGLMLTQRSDKALDDSVGSNFKTMAQLYANQVTQFLGDRVREVEILANTPAVISAASASKAQKNGLNEDASQVLRQYRALDPRFLFLTATNADADVVAASQRPSQMSFAQDPRWQAAYNQGQGKTTISDIVADTLAKAYYVTVGVPITNQTGQTVGVLSSAVNVTDLLATFRQENIASGARVALVNDDGNIVSAPNADVFARIKSQGFDFVHDALGSNQGTRSGWVMANLDRGDHIIGYASTGLKQHFPNLAWVVTITQEEHQAAAPIRQLERFAIVMVVLAIFMLTLLCVYYYLHRTQRFAHIEDDLPSGQSHSAAAGL